MLKSLLKKFNIVLPYSDFLYILQLEDYYIFRYFKWLPKFYFRRNIQKRDHLRFTSRTLITLGLTLITTLLPISLAIIFQSNTVLTIIVTLLSILAIPLWIGIVNMATTPVYNISKLYYQAKAKKLIASNPNLIIIGIAGSFGKTSTKNFLLELLRYNYKTQIVPGNINFPIGIAKWILTKFDTSSQVLIYETDGYKLGEVKSCAQMLPADYAVITNIGDQHLERLGSRKTLAKTLFELIQFSKPSAKLIMSEKTQKDFESLGVYIKAKTNREIINTSNPTNTATDISIEQASNLGLAKAIALDLQVSKQIVDDSISKMSVPDRRGNLINYFDFTTLDFTYNISATTSKMALKLAQKTAEKLNKKLIVITAGIPELGKENAKANFELGEEITKVADEIFLLKSDLHEEILKGIIASNYSTKSVFSQNTRIIDAMKEIDRNHMSNKEDYLVLQFPELTDLFY